MNQEIGKITALSLSQVWRREDNDFTPWLTENIEELDGALGIGLNNARREQPVGDFRVDIVAATYDDEIAIEVQYGLSDHRHFGQLLTYIAHPEQEISQGIWIVERARDEHVKAVKRLNEAETVRIWMVKASAIRIGDSLPAPLFEIVVAPTEAGESSDASSGADADRGLKRPQIRARNFQADLFAQAKQDEIDSPFERLSPKPAQSRETPAKGQRLLYRLAVKQGEARVELANRRQKWLKAFDELRAESDQIAHEFAEKGPRQELSWRDDRSTNGRWRVIYAIQVNLDEPAAASLRDLNLAAAAMKAVFAPRIKRLKDALEDAPLESDEAQEQGK